MLDRVETDGIVFLKWPRYINFFFKYLDNDMQSYVDLLICSSVGYIMLLMMAEQVQTKSEKLIQILCIPNHRTSHAHF